MNKCWLIGRLAKDIQTRKTAQSTVGNFTLAVDRRKKEDGADFISCAAWGKTAEIMAIYIKKGDLVSICGHIATGSYEKDGMKHFTTTVIVEEFQFLPNKRTESAPAPEATHDPEPADFVEVDDEELPF